ncbi:hypothetical protein [Caulobacter soli]|uniref:hypothetical protein n=1 Tax=Caulobacter soli TaxID=2708539 RepID=UPI0013EAF2E6|nr:hypothetical protein [Caulobacter soli]
MRHSPYLLAIAAASLLCATACDASPPKPAKPATRPIASDPQVEALRETLGRSVLDTPGLVLPDDHDALDAALARGDWGYLSQAVRNPGSAENMMRLANWERYQTYRGGGYNVAYMYVSTLTMAANSYDKAAARDPSFAPMANGMRRGALAQLLYTYAVLSVDGVRCADPTAPQAHRDQISSFTQELNRSTDALSIPERLGAIEAAIRQERQLAPVRDLDPALCRGGVAELTEALAAQPGRTTTTGPQPGYPGTNVMVPIDPNRPPAYSDSAQWPARQQAVRDGLLDQLAGVIGMSRKK